MALAPHLATSLGATSDASTNPTLQGAKMLPAVKGSSPSPVCTNKVKHKKNELDVEYTKNTSNAPNARRHDVHAPSAGMRKLTIDGKIELFEHTSLTIDEDRHLRLVVYAKLAEPSVALQAPSGYPQAE